MIICHIFSIVLLLLAIESNGSFGANPQPAVLQAQQQPIKQPEQVASVAAPNSVVQPGGSAVAANIKPLIQAALAAAPSVVGANFNVGTKPAGATVPETNQGQIVGQIQPQIQQHQAALTIKPTKILPETGPLNYGNEDPVIYLDYSTINDEILRRRTASFVYFNANFNHCRNCQKFFNIWKDLAIDIRWWRQVIKLYTINCSEEDNIEVCRRAGVTQFPQVRYYWIMSSSLERDGQRLRILGKSVHAMRHLIMDKVVDNYSEHNRLLLLRSQTHKQSASAASAAASISSNPISSLLGNPLINQLVAGGAGTSGLVSSMMSSLSSAKTSSGSLSGLVANLGGVQGINQLMSSFMAAINSEPKRSSNQPLPKNWPELEAIAVGDSQQLVDMLPLDATKSVGALLIMETPEFLYTGLETMLDLSPYGNQTYIARIRDERSQLTKNLTKRDDIQAPALIYMTAAREPRLIITAPKYTNDEDLRRAFVRAFERRQIKYPVRRVWSVSGAKAAASSSSESQEDEEVVNKGNQVYMSDLTNALRASLMEQVFRHPDLSDDQYNALVKYVYALINYFPFNNDESLKFFKRLHTWLQNQVSPMDISEYKKQFHDIDDVFQRTDWVACKSLSNTKTIPSKSGRRANSLFENPAQIGKVVSNITRLFRGQQQQASKLKNLFNALTNSVAPVMLSNNNSQKLTFNATTGNPNRVKAIGATNAPVAQQTDQEDSPIERIIKSLTSGSLGSDSSILKLISAALTGGSKGDSNSSTGKSKFAREYPCGIWKLAHVMVVNEYIKDSPRKDVKHIVLHSLYQYMLHFYACSTCGNRVSDVSGEFRLNLDESLQDQADSILLLWKVHNRVSKRLESELRPGLPPKLQFPSETLCPKCRAPRAQNDLVSTPNWHEKQVLNFLVHHYRPQSLIINTSSTFDSSAAPTLFLSLSLFALQLLCFVGSSLFINLHTRYYYH